MNELHDIAQRLTVLGKTAPSASSRREVITAMSSKNEGIRINAARVLAEWGDKASIEGIKELLSQLASGSDRSVSVLILVKVLFPHVSSLDRDWVFDLYFATPNLDNRLYLLELIYAYPMKATAAALAGRYRAGKNVTDIPWLLDRMQFHAIMNKRKD